MCECVCALGGHVDFWRLIPTGGMEDTQRLNKTCPCPLTSGIPRRSPI